MSSTRRDTSELDGLLHLSQAQCAEMPDLNDSQANYRELLRYALQVAVEREVAADVLVELRELLEQDAPAWYRSAARERVESALELLQRL